MLKEAKLVPTVLSLVVLTRGVERCMHHLRAGISRSSWPAIPPHRRLR